MVSAFKANCTENFNLSETPLFVLSASKVCKIQNMTTKIHTLILPFFFSQGFYENILKLRAIENDYQFIKVFAIYTEPTILAKKSGQFLT